jgi:hypothetical protein
LKKNGNTNKIKKKEIQQNNNSCQIQNKYEVIKIWPTFGHRKPLLLVLYWNTYLLKIKKLKFFQTLLLYLGLCYNNFFFFKNIIVMALSLLCSRKLSNDFSIYVLEKKIKEKKF